VNQKPWRDRFKQEDELVEQLQAQLLEAAKRRAQALAEGVAEMGSVYKVAKEVGKSWTAVNTAIKKHTTTE
jgi:molybdenum-dependent DNA-binding transcriptional regulator ModE